MIMAFSRTLERPDNDLISRNMLPVFDHVLYVVLNWSWEYISEAGQGEWTRALRGVFSADKAAGAWMFATHFYQMPT